MHVGRNRDVHGGVHERRTLVEKGLDLVRREGTRSWKEPSLVSGQEPGTEQRVLVNLAGEVPACWPPESSVYPAHQLH